MFVCMIECVVLLYTIVDFKSLLELVLYGCFISILNKTLNLNLNLETHNAHDVLFATSPLKVLYTIRPPQPAGFRFEVKCLYPEVETLNIPFLYHGSSQGGVVVRITKLENKYV